MLGVLTLQGFVSVPFQKKEKVQSLLPKFSQGLRLQLCQQCQVSKIKEGVHFLFAHAQIEKVAQVVTKEMELVSTELTDTLNRHIN